MSPYEKTSFISPLLIPSDYINAKPFLCWAVLLALCATTKPSVQWRTSKLQDLKGSCFSPISLSSLSGWLTACLPAPLLGGNFEFKDKTVSCGCSLQAYATPHTAAAIASPCCLSPFVIGRRLFGPQSRCMYLCSSINSAGDTASP